MSHLTDSVSSPAPGALFMLAAIAAAPVAVVIALAVHLNWGR